MVAGTPAKGQHFPTASKGVDIFQHTQFSLNIFPLTLTNICTHNSSMMHDQKSSVLFSDHFSLTSDILIKQRGGIQEGEISRIHFVVLYGLNMRDFWKILVQDFVTKCAWAVPLCPLFLLLPCWDFYIHLHHRPLLRSPPFADLPICLQIKPRQKCNISHAIYILYIYLNIFCIYIFVLPSPIFPKKTIIMLKPEKTALLQ